MDTRELKRHLKPSLPRLDRGQIVLSASGAYEAFGLWMSQHRDLFSFQRDIDE